MTKLPKQWNHWVKDSRLQNNCLGLRQYRGRYLKGRGRYWRVAGNTFQISDTIKDFDRWANSTVGFIDLPRTRAEFREAVEKLLVLAGEEIKDE